MADRVVWVCDAEDAWVGPLMMLLNRPLLPAGEREDECGPELIRSWLSMPSWDPETETTASCRDFWNKRLSTWPSSGGGRGALTVSRSSFFSLWVACPGASCSSTHRQLTGARTGGEACLRTALCLSLSEERAQLVELIRQQKSGAELCNLSAPKRKTEYAMHLLPIRQEWLTDREYLSYVCNPRSLKEGTVTSRPVATTAVPPLSGWILARLLSENLNMRCTCCLLILMLWSAAAGCNDHMPMCIGLFSLHSKWIGLFKRDPNSSVIRRNIECDRLIRNQNIQESIWTFLH